MKCLAPDHTAGNQTQVWLRPEQENLTILLSGLTSPRVLWKWILPSLSCVPEASSESSGAQLGARYAWCQVLLEQVASFWKAVMRPALTSTSPLGLWVPHSPFQSLSELLTRKRKVLVCIIFASVLHAVHITSKCTEARSSYPTPSLGISPT